MGQAKQRGTAEQRAKQARDTRIDALRDVDLGELRIANAIPDDATFAGYVVWLPERDEFLVAVHDSPHTSRSYAPSVDAAVKFPTWSEAAPHARASQYRAVVGAAFDLGKQVVVVGG